MIIGVDGTGEASADAYYTGMAGSFVQKLLASYCGRNKNYFRGPTLWGMETGREAEEVRDTVLCHLEGGDREIILTGYSRGGAAVIAAAQLLRKDPKFAELWKKTRPAGASRNVCLPDEVPKITCLALFDAVDRSTKVDTRVIPGNVEVAFHAMRSSASRSYFGNTGTRMEGYGRLVTDRFNTTHAGMGGLPGEGDTMIGTQVYGPVGLAYLALNKKRLDEREYRESGRVQTWMWANVGALVPLGAPMSVTPPLLCVA